MLSTVKVRQFLEMSSVFKKNLYLVTAYNCSSNASASRQQHVPEPGESKLLKVAVIGVPNAGKSTLINRILAMDVCPISKKAHTTRVSQNAVYLSEHTQIVFSDTPGVVNTKESKKFDIPQDFREAPEKSSREADLIAVVHSIENKILRNKLDPKVLTVLQKFPMKPAILLINKIDMIKGRSKLLDTVFYLCDGVVGGEKIAVKKEKRIPEKISMNAVFSKTRAKLKMQSMQKESHETDDAEGPSSYTFKREFKTDPNGRVVQGWSNFQDVFLISAKGGDGVDRLTNYLVSNARASPWTYTQNVLTDCPPAELALRIVTSKMLDYLRHELPYTIKPQLEYWSTNREGTLRIVMGLKCPNERLLPLIHGQNRLNVIQEESQTALTALLGSPVDLFLNVTLPENKKVR